jgi:hypothetical protein
MNNKGLFIRVGVILLAVAGLLVYRIYGAQRYAGITSFEECAKAGLPVMESYPARCTTPDGRSFTEKLTPEEQVRTSPPQQICQNKCGDNVCQEIVCMGSGCPCAESATTCPADCSNSSLE